MIKTAIVEGDDKAAADLAEMLCALGGTVAMFVPTPAACLCKPERLSAFSFVFPGRR